MNNFFPVRIPERFLSLLCLTLVALFLNACGTTSTTARRSPLPAYEPPLEKREFQSVRTTAYTHTEADHVQFSNRNALGGRLQAASGAIRQAENSPRSDSRRASYMPGSVLPFSMEPRKVTKIVKTKRGKKRVVVTIKPQIGSAAADWSRWPAGTVFRVISTGQVYKIDDYGWALAGRNTIDLYMPTRGAMREWGARHEDIQILRWGSTEESLRLLASHQSHRHIQRMVLELQGDESAAARLD